MILFLIVLGVLPSILWLSIYLREDEHPEPSRLILRMFFFGAISAPLAAISELLLIQGLEALSLPSWIAQIILFVVIIGIVEEFWKYLSVKITEEPFRSFDEPTDAMIYLIVAALGFAAVENVLAIFGLQAVGISSAFEVTTLRFLSATLLHVLASAILGYFLAKKHFFFKKWQTRIGLMVAGTLHGLYNLLTLASDGFSHVGSTLLIVLLLGVMAVVVNIMFYKLKKSYI